MEKGNYEEEEEHLRLEEEKSDKKFALSKYTDVSKILVVVIATSPPKNCDFLIFKPFRLLLMMSPHAHPNMKSKQNLQTVTSEKFLYSFHRSSSTHEYKDDSM